jgi:DNA replication protein DnaC
MAVTATEMNQRIDELLKYCGHNRVIVIDDLGTEAASVYGRRPFPELVDAAERTGTLLVITTNLRTNRDPDVRRNYPSIEARYGVPTLDRLRSLTKVAIFTGVSMRKTQKR